MKLVAPRTLNEKLIRVEKQNEVKDSPTDKDCPKKPEDKAPRFH